MAPQSGFPTFTSQTTWSLRRAWSSPSSTVTGKVIWPWHMAWRKRIDTFWGGKVQPQTVQDVWVTEAEYLVLKLKGET